MPDSPLRQVVARDAHRTADVVQGQTVRLRGGAFMSVLVDGCPDEVLVPYSQSLEPGAQLTVLRSRGGHGMSIADRTAASASGAAAFGGLPKEVVIEVSGLRVALAIPDVWPAGSIGLVVHLVGRGFSENPLDGFTAVDEEGVESTVVTIREPEFVPDPSTVPIENVAEGQSVVKVLVDVDAAAEVGRSWGVDVARGTV